MNQKSVEEEDSLLVWASGGKLVGFAGPRSLGTAAFGPGQEAAVGRKLLWAGFLHLDGWVQS